MTETPKAAPTMNDLMRAGKPAKPDPFAKYRPIDTEQDTENTEPKETDQ